MERKYLIKRLNVFKAFLVFVLKNPLSIFNGKLWIKCKAHFFRNYGEPFFGHRIYRLVAKKINFYQMASVNEQRLKIMNSKFKTLLEENGNTLDYNVKLKDGYAIDSSVSISYIDDFVKLASKICEENSESRKQRGKMVKIASYSDLYNYPSVYKFATSSAMISTVAKYLNCIPVLSTFDFYQTLPLKEGEVNQFDPNKRFHLDLHDSPSVRVIVLLNDVTSENGPFSFLPYSISSYARKKLNHGDIYINTISDELMYKTIESKELITLIAPKGSILFIDSSNCFHYGSRGNKSTRYVAMLTYTSCIKENFRPGIDNKEGFEILFNQFSTLGKMVLDAGYMAPKSINEPSA